MIFYIYLSYIPHIREKAFLKNLQSLYFWVAYMVGLSQSGFFWSHLSCFSSVPPWPSLFLSYQTIWRVPTPFALLPSGLCMCHISSGERDCQDGHSSPPLPEPTPPTMWLPLKSWGLFRSLECGLALGLASTQCNGNYCVPGLSLDLQKACMFPLVPLEGYPAPCERPWASLRENERAWGTETSSPSRGHATPTAPSQPQPPSSSLWMYSQVPDQQKCPAGPSRIASLKNHELNKWLF